MLTCSQTTNAGVDMYICLYMHIMLYYTYTMYMYVFVSIKCAFVRTTRSTL